MASTRSGKATLIPFICALCIGCGSESETGLPSPEGGAFPPPPRLLIVDETDVDSLRLRWIGPLAEVVEFEIQRRGPSQDDFLHLAAVPGDSETYTDFDVQTGETYYYRIRSIGPDGGSEFTQVARGEALSNQSPDPLGNPRPMDAILGLDAEITLSWAAMDPDQEPLVFDLYLGPSQVDMALVSRGLEDASYVPSPPLSLNTSYFWQVVARDPHGASSVSPLWVFSTRTETFVVEEGYFFMGDTEEFLHPGNPIRLAAFSIDKFEVTQQQYASFLNQLQADGQITVIGDRVYGSGATRLLLHLDLSMTRIRYEPDKPRFVVIPGLENHPVTGVTWYGAMAYGRNIGRSLPSESEWEKAARGTTWQLGDTTLTVGEGELRVPVTVGFGFPYPWGEGITPAHANYWDSGDPFEPGTTPVGFFDGGVHEGFQTELNMAPYGAFDMAGNVYEWTVDWMGDYVNPHNPPPEGEWKVIRGGAWTTTASRCRNVARAWAAPDSASASIGFRTVGPP